MVTNSFVVMVSVVFDKGEFKKMRFNVYEVPDSKDLMKHFPELSSMESFAKYAEADRNRLIRYIMLMYDKESPLVKRVQKYKDRQRQAAHLAGYDLQKHEDRLEQVFTLADESIANMVADFIILLNDRKWSLIVSSEATFYEFQRGLFMNVVNVRDDKARLDAITVKAKIMTESDEIDARLERYYSDLFGDDKLIEVAKKKRIRPESIASNS